VSEPHIIQMPANIPAVGDALVEHTPKIVDTIWLDRDGQVFHVEVGGEPYLRLIESGAIPTNPPKGAA